MIYKIELEENNNFGTSLIVINFANKNVLQIKNDITIKNETINIAIEELTDLVKKYVIYWNYEYINDKIIDGTITKLNIYTNDEILKYSFKNKYPYNYNEFINSLKAMVDIL